MERMTIKRRVSEALTMKGDIVPANSERERRGMKRRYERRITGIAEIVSIVVYVSAPERRKRGVSSFDLRKKSLAERMKI